VIAAEEVAGPHPVVEPVECFAVALAVRVIHRGQHIRRPGQPELDDGQCEAAMTLVDARRDQIAQRQRWTERLCRAAAGVAQCSGISASDLALAARRYVQAQWHVERGGGGPEPLVLGLVVAPVLGWILGDHRTGQAHAGGVPEKRRASFRAGWRYVADTGRLVPPARRRDPGSARVPRRGSRGQRSRGSRSSACAPPEPPPCRADAVVEDNRLRSSAPNR